VSILDQASTARHAYTAGFRGRDLAEIVAVAGGESSYNTDAVNRSSGATGLWQILPSAHPEFAGWNLKDPAVNARAAYSVYSSAPNPGKITRNKWSAYMGLRYLAYLPSSVTAAALAESTGPATDATVDAVGTVSAAAGVASDALEVATNPRTWLRAAYVAAGVALVIVAAATVASQSPAGRRAVAATKRGAKRAATVAVTKGVKK
jgi:hypothetical protein